VLAAALCVGLAVAGTAGTMATASATPPDSGNASAGPPTGAGVVLNAPIVGVAARPDGGGYWEAAADGGIFSFGDAPFYGSTGSLSLNRPIVGVAATPDGRGYWEVASDGGVFAFGDAHFFGSASGLSPDSPVVGVAATADGRGYWEAAADGAVYAFGDGRFAGVAPAGKTVVGIGSAGAGYRLVDQDGGIYAFGGATFDGSVAGRTLNKPVIGLAVTGRGYLAIASDGGVFTFGGEGYFGSLAGSTVGSAVVVGGLTTDDGVTDAQRAAWERVNLCEEGGRWNVEGSVFSGGLGFSRSNWAQFNTFGYPADAARATPEEQIRVAVAFASRYWGNPDAAPDQHGCSGGY
jgi:hypothetical protein